MNNKYELTNVTIEFMGRTLFQIKAKRSFGNVDKGELGGYIEKEENLNQEGNAWVYGDAIVSGNARVHGDAIVYGNARVYGDAWVYGDARVYGDAIVSGNAWVYGNARLVDKKDYIKGWFIGGDDSGKITDITDKTGTNYWKNQYVLGEWEIKDREEQTKKVTLELTDEQLEQIKEIIK